LANNQGLATQQRSFSYAPGQQDFRVQRVPERMARREVLVKPADTGPSDEDVREK